MLILNVQIAAIVCQNTTGLVYAGDVNLIVKLIVLLQETRD